MEINNILKTCMKFGLVKFEIYDKIVYPTSIIKEETDLYRIYLIGDAYVCDASDIKLLSIDIDKLKEVSETLSFILEYSEKDMDLSDLSKVSSLLILKKLKEKDNDIERVDFLTEYLDNQNSLLDGLINTDDYDREVADEISIDITDDTTDDSTGENNEEDGLENIDTSVFSDLVGDMDFRRFLENTPSMEDIQGTLDKFIEEREYRRMVEENDERNRHRESDRIDIYGRYANGDYYR